MKGRNDTGLNSNDELKYLSQEEQEILHFFEQTIDSLEQSLEEDELRPQVKALNDSTDGVVDGASYSVPHPQANAKEQDIIDLVRSPKPDVVQTKETTFTPTSPDFQSLIPHPESHFEIKPRNEHAPDPVPDHNSTFPENYPLYHPPGSIPTPVLIAQKIAENQAGGGSSVLSASSLLRRRSSEFDKSTSSNKHGPPTSTKPARYPANISVILGNREQQNQSHNINLEERRAQMLSNLSGTSHPLVQEESHQDQKDRNTPTRSVSFRDPTPEKSRMEALSKLGLTRNRAMSGGVSLPSPPPELLTAGEAKITNVKNPDIPEQSSRQVSEPIIPPNIHTNMPQQPSSPLHSLVSSNHPEMISSPNVIPTNTSLEPSNPSSIKPQEPTSLAMLSTSSKAQETKPRSPLISNKKTEIPPLDVQKSHQTVSYSPPPAFSQKDYFPFPPAPPPVETSPEFNSYGGKSIVLNPSASFKTNSPSSPISPEAKTLPPILATPSEFNSYGGKSKVMTPLPVPVARRDLPDILSSHIDKSQTPHSPPKSDSNSYGGRTRTVNPSVSASRPSEGMSRTLKPPAPLPAPKPARHSYHGPTATPKSPQRALSPDHRRRTGSLFRPQGITVQFSGKGAMDESRREALRKLGLLKE